ncbi:unnamed protein product [Lupinus luteus]|uniref:Uncharacterized protein n=1 Tax=Lupinus luteus TaxID=3873 RepID=A0AAV1XTA0_LUPLU
MGNILGARKYLLFGAAIIVAEAETVDEAEAEDDDDVDDDGDEMIESCEFISFSSSLIVSNILDVLCLITLIYCGGATSMKSLAIREFAIVCCCKKSQVFIGKKKKLQDKKERVNYAEFGLIEDVYEAKGKGSIYKKGVLGFITSKSL